LKVFSKKKLQRTKQKNLKKHPKKKSHIKNHVWQSKNKKLNTISVCSKFMDTVKNEI